MSWQGSWRSSLASMLWSTQYHGVDGNDESSHMLGLKTQGSLTLAFVPMMLQDDPDLHLWAASLYHCS